MAKILIKNGRVWNGEAFLYADVLIDGRLIAKISPEIRDEANFVFDAEGMIVSAGFVDAHTHLRGVSCDKYGTQAEISCFPFGVTSAADGAASQGDKRLVESFMLKTVAFAGAEIRENRADFTNTEKILSLYGDRIVGIKSYFDISAGDIRSIAPLREICEYAHQRCLAVMVHCTNSPVALSEILETLGSGDILTHSFNGSTNNAECDSFVSMNAAQRRGVLIDVGFAGNVHTDFGILKRAIQSGIVPDIISTDITRLSAFVRGGRYGMTMCMSIAKALGMKEDDVFRAVTTTPAGALGINAGHIKEGACADIAVVRECDEPVSLVDKNQNSVALDKSYRCMLTVSDGQIVYKD